MKFSCDRCDAQYMISDEKIGPKGVRVRCKKCGNVISVRRPLENGAAAEERPAPAAAAPAGVAAAAQGNLEAELGQAFDHAFGGEATTPAVAAPMSAAAEAARADAAVSEPGALQLPAGDELPAFAVAARPARTPAPAAPPATEWYVAIGQAQVGPLPLEEVRRKWEGADVGPDSLVWRPGMGDWAPLSSVADLAAYLAPFPVAARQSRTPAPGPSPYQASGSPAATPLPGGEVIWKPVGASALAALASEEIATRATPEPRAERATVNGGAARSLVEKMDLPDGGGVDPTGAIPLPMKALDTTGEHGMERISSVARGAEEIRHKRSAARGIAVAVVALLLVGGAAAAWLLKGRAPSGPVPSAPVAAAPLPAAPVPEATPVRPAEPAVAAPAAAPAPATAEAAKPEPAQPDAPKADAAAPQAVAAAPAQAAPAAEPAAPAAAPAKAAPAPTTRAARREALRKERLAQAAAAKEAASRSASKSAATAAPAPAPEQPKRRRDVLDFESNDAALEAALGASKPTGSRSVYVPPPPSGSVLPDRVTDSQVNETILGRVSALQQCVQEQKARDAEGTGVLKMRWAIAPDGSVRDPKCVTSEFASSPIAKCLSGVLNATRFPRSKMGRQDVTFPIKF